MVATTCRVYRPGNPAPETVNIGDWPDDPGFSRISAAVRPLLCGAHLERVRVWDRDSYLDMFVDEEGAIKKLPVNGAATAIYHANMLRGQPGADTSLWPRIHGVAVVFDRRVWF
jgi:hypothetical protein